MISNRLVELSNCHKSSIFIRFSTLNQPFWDTSIYGNPHLPHQGLHKKNCAMTRWSNHFHSYAFFSQFLVMFFTIEYNETSSWEVFTSCCNLRSVSCSSNCNDGAVHIFVLVIQGLARCTLGPGEICETSQQWGLRIHWHQRLIRILISTINCPLFDIHDPLMIQ